MSLTVPWEHFQQSEPESVKSDFLIKNIFSYMIQKQYKINIPNAKNLKEKETLENIKGIIYQFSNQCGSDLRNECLKIDPINEDTVQFIVSNIFNELFSEGITQIKIVTFFAFIGELTRIAIARKVPNSLVDEIFRQFSKCVHEKLELWIQDHGGWASLFRKKAQKHYWVNSLMCTLLKIMGIVSNIENTLNGNWVFDRK